MFQVPAVNHRWWWRKGPSVVKECRIDPRRWGVEKKTTCANDNAQKPPRSDKGDSGGIGIHYFAALDKVGRMQPTHPLKPTERLETPIDRLKGVQREKRAAY
jgi:hypothetical protein